MFKHTEEELQLVTAYDDILCNPLRVVIVEAFGTVPLKVENKYCMKIMVKPPLAGHRIGEFIRSDIYPSYYSKKKKKKKKHG